MEHTRVLPVRRAYGRPVFEEDPTRADLYRPALRRPRGRPRADVKAARISQLKDEQKKSWRVVCEIVTAEFPDNTTTDAPRSLYRSRRRAGGIRRSSVLEQVFLQLLESKQPKKLRVPKRRGRPREDRIRFDGLSMLRDGKTLPDIQIELNAKYKQTRSLNAYEKLCRMPKYPAPVRKLDLGVIRGK